VPRLKLKLTPLENFSWSEMNQGHLVGLMWSIIRDTPFGVLHDQRGYKFFTFSEIFPFGDFHEGEPKYIIVSSPDRSFISALKDAISDGLIRRIGAHPVAVEVDKTFRLKPSSAWESGSPVVVRFNDGSYWSPRKGHGFTHFVQKLTQNALEKYRAYYGESLDLPGPIFEGYSLMKSVAHSFWKKNGDRVLIIGSKWRFKLPPFWKEYKKLYSFIMDVGLGEKNAMGYGFVNPLRGGKG